ncbi:MAG: HlyD family type I secretion periplasmic adaptor subunit [Oceanicaulis sp.]
MSVLSAIRLPTLVGGGVVAAFITIFIGWGGFVPIAGGAVAAGQISPEGSRRTVQHLEGGIVEALQVSNGDMVREGDTLVILQETQARSGVRVLAGQRDLLSAQRARLRSEQLGHDAPHFPEALLNRAEEAAIADILEVQRDLFAQRIDLHENRRSMLRQRIGQLEAEIAGLEAQIVSQRRRAELISSEIADTQSLYDRGLAPRPRLLALQREEASISEGLAANQASIARARQSIGETEIQILTVDAQRLDEISTELNQVQAQLAEVTEQLLASEDVLRRTRILAPISGTVVNLQIFTVGGVIRPGDPILDIVPGEERLVIDARLSPLHVDVVAQGQEVKVVFSALDQRKLPRISGEVVSVSADAITDPDTGERYYALKVQVDRDQLDAIVDRTGADIELIPGMPAEVLVVTGERTLLEYLIEPLRASLRNALREP